MLLNAWLYTTPAAFAVLDGGNVDQYVYQNRIPLSLWNEPQLGYEVYSIIGTESQIAEFVTELGADLLSKQEWEFGTGYDHIQGDGSWGTEPADVLGVMPDFVTYDQDGNPVGTDPASYENPNWASVFAGQQTQIFAGSYSDDFNEDYR